MAELPRAENDRSTSPHVVMFGGDMVSHCVQCLLLARKLCALGINITFINTELTISKLKVRSEHHGQLALILV